MSMHVVSINTCSHLGTVGEEMKEFLSLKAPSPSHGDCWNATLEFLPSVTCDPAEVKEC